ncbi:putative cadherin-4-like, partial [Triplophysa rosa]
FQLNIEKKIISEYIVHGQGLDKDPKGIFSIDTAEGSIYVHGKVDYEKYKHLTITFESREKSPTLVVDIEILDVNDHAPVFNKLVYETTIHESTPQGEDLVTVLATDDDQDGTANSLLTFRVVSVTPSPSNAEFFIQQTEGETIGKISFKGCLEYEEARQYTILVEAKDHGKKVQLSSTGTVIVKVIDKNNYQPEITGKTGSVWVKEGKRGEPVCRLQVTDKDSRGSPAWRAKYSLQGEKADHFKIETDPETNDGVITVIEPLDYEEKSNLNLIVNVENEEPFFYCRVKGRPSKGLWDVENSQRRSISTSVSLPMTVVVEDVNDPPVFVEPIKHITVMENVGTTVRLIKEDTVFVGDHKLTLKISDTQGQNSIQTILVRVCNCDITANCNEPRAPTIKLKVTAVAVITLSFITLLGNILVCDF